MAQPDARAAMRSVRAQAEAVVNACAAMERPPADIQMVAEMSAVAKKCRASSGVRCSPRSSATGLR